MPTTFDPLLIKLVVFDLDGTIADTAALLPGDARRRPYDVLKYSGPSEITTPLVKIQNIQKICNDLIQCGVRVAIITNSPRAYASTLCALLRIDFDVLIAANSHEGLNTKILKLRWMSKPDSLNWGESIPPNNILYVGDRDDDESAAKAVGCHFERIPPKIKSLPPDTALSFLARYSSDALAEGLTEDKSGPFVNAHMEYLVGQSGDFGMAGSSGGWIIDPAGPYANFDPDLLPDIVNELKPQSPVQRPIINPKFVTRYAYDNDANLLSKLLSILHESLGSKRIHGSAIRAQLEDVEIHSHLKYSSNRLAQELWKQIKNWQNFSAGSEVELLHLEFVALCMASSIRARGDHAVIVPMPSSAFSAAKPGRVSYRLATRISQILNFPYFELFYKDDSKSVCTHPEGFPFSHKAILIDDQITDGILSAKCVELMQQMSLKDYEIRTWSASKFFPMDVAQMASSAVLASPEVAHSIDQVPRVGRKIHHQKYGMGVITKVFEFYLEIDFGSMGTQLMDKEGLVIDFIN